MEDKSQKLIGGEDTRELLPCLCCGTQVVSIRDGYEICEVCGWEDDPVQSREPDYAGGANKLSLNQNRKKFLEKK